MNTLVVLRGRESTDLKSKALLLRWLDPMLRSAGIFWLGIRDFCAPARICHYLLDIELGGLARCCIACRDYCVGMRHLALSDYRHLSPHPARASHTALQSQSRYFISPSRRGYITAILKRTFDRASPLNFRFMSFRQVNCGWPTLLLCATVACNHLLPGHTTLQHVFIADISSESPPPAPKSIRC